MDQYKIMTLTQDMLYQAIDKLRAISTMGLYYAKTEYDKERYQHVLSVALGLLANLEERPFEEVEREFVEDNWLHMSPASGAEALIVRDEKIMLIKRSDNGLWAVPGGLVEVGETLAEAAQRELWEETGIQAQVTKLLGIFDSRLWQSKTKAHLFHAIFLADATNLMPKTSCEAIEIGFLVRMICQNFPMGMNTVSLCFLRYCAVKFLPRILICLIMSKMKATQHSVQWTAGILRVFRQFAWLEVDSGKITSYSPAHQPRGAGSSTGNASR